jgi:hypothetical protein
VSTHHPIWRVGTHYGVHVYEVRVTVDDRPVATFHDKKDAALACEAVNQFSISLEDQIAGEVARRVENVHRSYAAEAHRHAQEVGRLKATLGELREALTTIYGTAEPHARTQGQHLSSKEI